MQIKYFPDTDTLLIDFADRDIAESKDNGENVLVERDADGGLVSITIEHAKSIVNGQDFKRHEGGNPNRTEAKGDFWEAMQEFRAVMEREGLYYDGVFDNVRDRSPGREIEL